MTVKNKDDVGGEIVLNLPFSLVAALVGLLFAFAVVVLAIFLVDTPVYRVRVGNHTLLITLNRKKYRKYIDDLDEADEKVIFEVKRLTRHKK